MTTFVQRFRWLRTELPFVAVAVLMLASVGYLLVLPDHWRRGVGLIAIATLLAALLRAALPSSKIGILAVRGRKRDAVAYALVGVVILVVEIRLH